MNAIVNKSNPAKKDQLDKLVQLIVEMYNPAKIVLFGSQARGNWTEESDFDILVIDCSIKRPMGEVKPAAIRANIKLLYDVVKTTSEDLAKHKDSLNHVLAHAQKEGVVIYSSES